MLMEVKTEVANRHWLDDHVFCDVYFRKSVNDPWVHLSLFEFNNMDEEDHGVMSVLGVDFLELKNSEPNP